MDKESTRLKPDEREPAMEVNRLRTEIEAARDELGTYIFELDRRRHEALDLKLQLKKHPAFGIGVGVAAAAAVAGAVAMVVRARRRKALEPSEPWAPWRITARTGLRSAEPSRLLGFVFRSAIPIGIGVARSLLDRGKSRRARLA